VYRNDAQIWAWHSRSSIILADHFATAFLMFQSLDERWDGFLDFRRFSFLGARVTFCFIQAVPDNDIDESQWEGGVANTDACSDSALTTPPPIPKMLSIPLLRSIFQRKVLL
jgi:hypothetical protein